MILNTLMAAEMYCLWPQSHHGGSRRIRFTSLKTLSTLKIRRVCITPKNRSLDLGEIVMMSLIQSEIVGKRYGMKKLLAYRFATSCLTSCSSAASDNPVKNPSTISKLHQQVAKTSSVYVAGVGVKLNTSKYGVMLMSLMSRSREITFTTSITTLSGSIGSFCRRHAPKLLSGLESTTFEISSAKKLLCARENRLPPASFNWVLNLASSVLGISARSRTVRGQQSSTMLPAWEPAPELSAPLDS
mmetsp:Transcript_46741/g.109019  ORF Transcript_46741/g.109019 Transcript_46741/m.109019 type:complete len:244 (-) Transcript_46741:489-1220(-)